MNLQDKPVLPLVKSLLMQGVSFIPAMIGLFAISGAIKYYVDRWKEKAN